jgi:hypothetical protein
MRDVEQTTESSRQLAQLEELAGDTSDEYPLIFVKRLRTLSV